MVTWEAKTKDLWLTNVDFVAAMSGFQEKIEPPKDNALNLVCHCGREIKGKDSVCKKCRRRQWRGGR
jgi:hypothetical protein